MAGLTRRALVGGEAAAAARRRGQAARGAASADTLRSWPFVWLLCRSGGSEQARWLLGRSIAICAGAQEAAAAWQAAGGQA